MVLKKKKTNTLEIEHNNIWECAQASVEAFAWCSTAVHKGEFVPDPGSPTIIFRVTSLIRDWKVFTWPPRCHQNESNDVIVIGENPTENTHQTGKVHPAKWGLTLSTCGFCMILPWGSGMVASDFTDVRSDCTWERNGNCTILQYWFCLLLSRKKKTVKTSTMMKNVAQWT